MLLTKRGTAGGDRGRLSRRVSSHHIRVSLNYDDPALPGDILLCEVEPVEDLRLVIDRGFRGVQVLGGIRVLTQSASPEAHCRTRNVADWPHHAVTEAVVRATLPPDCQTCRDDLIVGKRLRTQVPRQTIPAGR